MTTRVVTPKSEGLERAVRAATHLRTSPGEIPHALHAEPGSSGGAPHRPRSPRPGVRRRDQGGQARLSRLYARQLTLRLMNDQSPNTEGAEI